MDRKLLTLLYNYVTEKQNERYSSDKTRSGCSSEFSGTRNVRQKEMCDSYLNRGKNRYE